MAMSSLAPAVGWTRIKLDFKSFFYRANMKLCVMALKEHKIFKQILQLKVAFAQRGSMVVFYDSADYGKVSFQAPLNGLLPGHTLSSNLCSISAKSAWDCASKMLYYESCIRDNGNPVVGCALLNICRFLLSFGIVMLRICSLMTVVSIYGLPHLLAARVACFSDICRDRSLTRCF